MNKKQKIVFLVGLGIIVLMGLFPPWYWYSSNSPGKYAFIFSSDPVFYQIGNKIDVIRLFLQWTVVAIATGGMMIILKDGNGRAQK